MKLPAIACLFLILLRLAIGWHLLIEGCTKLESISKGTTTKGPAWSSKPYLLESAGPLASWFRSIPGDPDDAALTLLKPPAGEEPRLPQELYARWEKLVAGWSAFYRMTEEQASQAKKIFKQHSNVLAQWFRHGVKEVERSFPKGSVQVTWSTPERLAEYERALQEYRRILESGHAFNEDAWKQERIAARQYATLMRSDLLQDVDKKTKDLERALRDLLTEEQKKMGSYVVPQETNTLLWLTDIVTAWGLTIVGGMLIVGLFTRLASVGGMGLLLLFYLAMPPLPWLPENPKSEGHYLLINKTLIEVLALGVLATLPTGRWAGLDGLLALVFRKKHAGTAESPA